MLGQRGLRYVLQQIRYKLKTHTFSQVEPLKISVFEVDAWRFPPHRHTHYELIYILAGAGQHTINAHHYPYQAGDLFLFNTHDVHHFQVGQRTRFCVVEMNPGFLEAGSVAFAPLRGLLEQEHFFTQPAFDAATRAYVGQQMHFCMAEFARQALFYEQAIQASIFSVLVLLCRTQAYQQAALAPASGSLAAAVVQYIHAHLRAPGQLSAAALAQKFHRSPRYMGQFFRREVGQGLKQFVLESRVQALQQELKFSDKTVSQLADEYGFADESHLAKVFKAVVGSTPILYRAGQAQAGTLGGAA